MKANDQLYSLELKDLLQYKVDKHLEEFMQIHINTIKNKIINELMNDMKNR